MLLYFFVTPFWLVPNGWKEVDLMIRKLLRQAGFMLISYGTLFTPVLAYADDGNSTLGAVVGFPAGAIITGAVLVSMSHTKTKATKANKYVKGQLDLHLKEDEYLRTEKTSRKLKDD